MRLLNLSWWLLLSVLLAGCSLLSSPPPPTPTSSLSFVTTTSAAGTPVLPSPTLTLTTATPIPTLIVTPTLTPSPSPSPTLTPIPATFTLTPIPKPQAVINGPNGALSVRGGPGLTYDPPLGVYNNGVVVEVLGRQYAPTDGALWWLIAFPPGPYGQGWVYANYTIAKNVDNVPWVTPPPTPTPAFTPTPTPRPRPQAVVNSPDGYLYVRRGPGSAYPTLAVYNNGVVVDLIGKQFAPDGALWWLIPFNDSFSGLGWIYADYTLARYANTVPWAPAPPLPETPTLTPTPTPAFPAIVSWTITGRVVKTGTSQPIAGASIRARLGNDGASLTVLTDANGNFLMTGSAHDDGNLLLAIAAPGYTDKNLTVGAIKPRVYNFPVIELVPAPPATVAWSLAGRAVEIGTGRAIPNALVEAILGTDAVHLQTLTGANGQFSLNGQARDSGNLSLSITADGYQPFSLAPSPAGVRVYTLGDLPLVPLAGSCAYESVLNLPQAAALARLQTLNFTQVVTTPINVGGNANLLDRVLTQEPNPPPEGQSQRVSCQLPVTLGVGVTGNQ